MAYVINAGDGVATHVHQSDRWSAIQPVSYGMYDASNYTIPTAEPSILYINYSTPFEEIDTMFQQYNWSDLNGWNFINGNGGIVHVDVPSPSETEPVDICEKEIDDIL